MKAKLTSLIAATAIATAVSSCGGGLGFGKIAMDSEEAVNKVKDIVTESVNPSEWKLVEIEWNEGTSDREKLGNDLGQGSIFVKMVRANGQVFTQGFVGQLGFKPTDLSPDHWYDEGLDYDKVTPIDASKLDPAAIVAQIDKAKSMIPEDYEFKSVASYEITAGIPASSSGKGEYTTAQTAEFRVNVVEKGNETVSNAGSTSIIYYEIDFDVDADGNVTMDAQ